MIGCQSVAITTNRRLISRTGHATLALLGRIERTRRQGVGSPALAAVLQADPLVVPGKGKTVGHGHVVCGGDELGQGAGVGRLNEAAIVGEVCVTLDDYTAGGGGGGGGGAG